MYNLIKIRSAIAPSFVITKPAAIKDRILIRLKKIILETTFHDYFVFIGFPTDMTSNLFRSDKRF